MANRRHEAGEAEYHERKIVLQLEISGQEITARFGRSAGELTVLGTADGRRLNPEKVGGMIGTIIGMYASGNGNKSENTAKFEYFAQQVHKPGRVNI